MLVIFGMKYDIFIIYIEIKHYVKLHLSYNDKITTFIYVLDITRHPLYQRLVRMAPILPGSCIIG